MTASSTAAAIRPVRRGGVLTCPTRNEIVLFDPVSSTALGLNLSASTIWTMCDGSRSADEIVDELSAVVGLEPARLRGDVEALLDRLLALRLLTAA